MVENLAYLAEDDGNNEKRPEKVLDENDLGFDYLFLRLPQMRFVLTYRTYRLQSIEKVFSEKTANCFLN